MVQNTQYWIDEFADAGADIITVHVEQPDVDDLLDQIHNHGCSAGIALKVETPVSALTPLVHKPDLILLLGTSIGIKGASISNNAFERIEDTVSLLKDHDRRDDVIVTADGGVRNHTVEPLRSAGADMITPGSLFFGNPDLALAGETIHKLATNNA